MSDLGAVDTAAPESTPAVDAAPEAPVEAAAADPEHVPWGDYVKLRNENADYRRRWQPFERALAGYNDEDRQFLLDQFLPSFHSEPQRFIELSRTLADRLEAELTPAQQEEIEEAGEAAGLAPEQVAAIVRQEIEAREAERAKNEAIEGIYKELGEAGIERDTADAAWVLYTAQHQTEGDLAKAIALWKERDQRAIDAFVASKKGPQPTPSAGTSPRPAKPDIAQMSDREFREFVRGSLRARGDATQ